MWWGKIIGFLIGYWLLGTVGALLGVLAGHLVDVYRSHPVFIAFRKTQASMQEMRKAFFNATFLLMGHIAKSDGRVSPQEIEAARAIMQQMALTDTQKQQAMHLFTQGKDAKFDLDNTLAQLMHYCRGNFILLQMFVDIQLKAANLSGDISAEKQRVLEMIFSRLGYAPFSFRNRQQGYSEHRQQHHHYAPHTYSRHDKLIESYQILGVSETASQIEIKRAYRRLMSQHHPDKLVAKGLPEEMMKMATEKTQNIQKAYETVKEARGF